MEIKETKSYQITVTEEELYLMQAAVLQSAGKTTDEAQAADKGSHAAVLKAKSTKLYELADTMLEALDQ